MSIICSYDDDRKALISPENCYEKSEFTLDACVLTFSQKTIEVLLEKGLITKLGETIIKSVALDYPMYVFKDTNIGVFKSTVGAPITSGMIEEISHVYNCNKIVMFGSCGGLDKSISPNKLIVPTHAYRDEGTSYHYMPASDYIEIKNATKVGKILSELNIDFVYGKTWTTDAFYRETQKNMNARKSEGCIAVEMEVSACQAVASFRNIEFYNFLYRADNLDSEKWDRGILGLISIDDRIKNFFVALEIAKRIICKIA